jgi:Tol biopolymer transport system component
VSELLRVGEEAKDPEFATWLVDITTKKKTTMKLPSNQHVTDWSSDGKYFLTTEAKAGSTRLHLVSRDGTEDRALLSTPASEGRLSPDGSKVLYLAPDPERVGKGTGLFVLDIRSGEATRVGGQPLNGASFGHCWSPDGKRIAHAWRLRGEGGLANKTPTKTTESSLIVSDMDGQNPVVIATERAGSGQIAIAHPDWR